MGMALLAGLGGCVSLKQPVQRIDHYMLEYDPPSLAVERVLPAVIRVERFSAAPFYQSNRMLFKPGDYLSDGYRYHRWRAAPGDMLAYFIARDMQQSKAFRAVGPGTDVLPFTHTLQGTVDEFFEDDGLSGGPRSGGPRGREAVVAVTVVLLAENEIDLSRQIVMQQHFSARMPSRRKHPQAFAEAMSVAVQSLSAQIMEAVAAALTAPSDNNVNPSAAAAPAQSSLSR
jgi:ABC-type uncharacterized transport system auxiliary subunit